MLKKLHNIPWETEGINKRASVYEEWPKKHILNFTLCFQLPMEFIADLKKINKNMSYNMHLQPIDQ